MNLHIKFPLEKVNCRFPQREDGAGLGLFLRKAPGDRKEKLGSHTTYP